MKLLFVTHEFPPQRGGIATFVREVALAAVRQGHDVKILAPRDAEDLNLSGTKAKDGKLSILPIQIRANHNLPAVLGMARALSKAVQEEPEREVWLLEPGAIQAAWVVLHWPKMRLRRLTMVFHGSEIARAQYCPWWRLPIRAILNRAERVAAVSEFTRNQISRLFLLSLRKIQVVPMGCPRSGITPGVRRKRDSDVKRILTVARMHPRKGQDFALQALSRLPADLLVGWEYRIVGEGRRSRYRQNLQRLAEQVPCPVHFIGGLSDDAVAAEYAEADIFMLTSRSLRGSVEGFGLVYREAGLYGLPVVACAVGGVSEAVLDGVSGLLAPADDRDRAADVLARLIRSPALRQRLGAGGKKLALESSWNDTLNHLLAVEVGA